MWSIVTVRSWLRVPSSRPSCNFLLVGHSVLWFDVALLIDGVVSADANSVDWALFVHPFSISIFCFNTHIRVTGHRLEEWSYLTLRWCVDRPSNKDIKHLWLQRGDLPAINMSYVFSWAYQDSEDETHSSYSYAYEPKPKWENAVTEPKIFRAFAYAAAAALLFSPINVMSFVLGWH